MSNTKIVWVDGEYDGVRVRSSSYYGHSSDDGMVRFKVCASVDYKFWHAQVASLMPDDRGLGTIGWNTVAMFVTKEQAMEHLEMLFPSYPKHSLPTNARHQK